MMRKSSTPILQTQTSEPVIVVEDSNCDASAQEEETVRDADSQQNTDEDESPTMNPYLLSPYAREIRKHSLPTPQCSGITASQVRRLSERGETVGPGPRQAEFLATLSTAPTPTPGGRRHSVVTISKVPTTLFGRNRRESVAAFPTFPVRILGNRRESIAGPPSTEPRGSVHNLQLDIMDDIVQARKVRMKMWNTSSEKVCEVQPLDDTASVQRYNTNSSRRYSDFVGTTLAPIPSSSTRRASELPASTSASKGIVCTNTDLMSILSPLSTSSTDVTQCESKCGRLKSNRSNSFDVSILNDGAEESPASTWLAQRHQPKPVEVVVEKEPAKVVWDERSGSMVDAQALGSAIEDFLRQTPEQIASKPKKSSWFANKTNDGADSAAETCDSSICSTLKDLFVK